VIDLCDVWGHKIDYTREIVDIVYGDKDDLEWNHIHHAIDDYEISLDFARIGQLRLAMNQTIHDGDALEMAHTRVPSYEDDPVGFKIRMREIVEMLESRGL